MVSEPVRRAKTAASLVEYISGDLRRGIINGELAPEDLTISELVARYRVSATPIRSAIMSLVDEGLLCRQPNRRIFIDSKIRSTVGQSEIVTAPLTLDEWDSVLMKQVMTASLSKKPVYLREEAIASRFDVGRSIVRQVFSRFAGARLIEHVPRKGWLVWPLKHENMLAYLVVREMFEEKALELAWSSLVRKDLELMLEKTKTESELGDDIHKYILKKSGNRYIIDFFQQYIAIYFNALFYYAAPETSVVAEMRNQHCEIISQILDQNRENAASLLRQHIRAQGPILMELLGMSKQQST
jgi:DNA-binding GntR family transcriptional regulator